MKNLNLRPSDLWETLNPDVGILTAPLEVHKALTNKCSAECPHCYMDSCDADPDKMGPQMFKNALQILADAGIFHAEMAFHHFRMSIWCL